MLHLAAWGLLTLYIVGTLLTSILVCQCGSFLSHGEVPVTMTLWALDMFLLTIGTLCATMTFEYQAEACVLINIIGIVLGWPICYIREYQFTYFVDWLSQLIM